MSGPDRELSWAEKLMLIQNGVQEGETVSVDRGHPHTSTDTPYEHTDVLAVRNDGGGNFTVTEVFHVPTGDDKK